MAAQIIVLEISALICVSSAILNPHGPTVISDCSNCILNIIKKEFIKPGFLIFANTDNVSNTVSRIRTEILKNINKEIRFAVEVLSPSKEEDVCEVDNFKQGRLHVDHYVINIPPANYFIIVIDNFGDFSHLASKIIRSRTWNPYAKIIILLFNIAEVNRIKIKNVEKILTCLFKFNAVDVAIAVPQTNKFRTAVIYNWKPYDAPKYCGYFNETAVNRLIEANSCENGALKYKKTIFGNKIPRHLKGCVINVLALQRQPYISHNKTDANIEKILINRLAKEYQMITNYILLNGSRGERETLGEWEGGLHNVTLKHGDILLGGIFPDYDVHEDFDSSLTYLADAYIWVVPKAPKLPRWASMVNVFEKFVWYSAICALFICVATWKVVGKKSEDTQYNKSFSHCFFNTWITIFGFVCYTRPKKVALRVFVVFLNIYSVLFLTAYQTNLFLMLTNPSYEHQIQTLEEIVNSGLKFGGMEELHGLFVNSSDPYDSYIGNKWVEVHNMTSAMIDVAVHRNFSILCSRLELGHLAAVLPELSDPHGNSKFYAFEEDTFNVPMEFIALRGYPFMQQFSRTITRFKASGLNEAIRYYYANFNKRRRATLLRLLTHKQNDVKALSIQHLQGGFMALALGYIGGTLILIVEILLNHTYVKRKLKNCKIKKWT